MIQTKHSFANAAISNDGEILQDIHLKSKNIAIYQRDIHALNQELEQISDKAIEYKASGTVAEILSLLKDYFNDHLAGCPLLYDDVSVLLKLFEKTSQASSFRLLLATVRTNMCRKFHTDVNDLRMLCTYKGPGTLWVPDEAIDQEASRARGSKQEMVLDLKQIQQASTGDAVILKGALYPDADPILHRSPSIEEHGEKRLLLRIDTNEFLNFWK